ncbi:MAG: hypothetical protein PHH84_05680, partial [Oscillospiraceae bacterium]|nr:hypothetical protein [Oscillospiraceae bacterium]
AGFTAKLSFPSGSQAEPFQAIGRNVVIDVDETPYLYIDTSGYAANTWIELRIGNSISDTSLLDTITESTIKKYDLRETFPEGGVQSFCIAMTLIDGGKIGHGFSFNYLFIGNEAADPANSTAASDIGWSADIGAQKSKWNYFGKNTAGTVVSQNFNNLDANCPLIITTGEANEYDGTAFNVKFNWTDDSEADFYQRIGYQVTLDTSIYSKLYFKADFGKNDVIELLLCEDVGSIPMFSNPAMNSDLGMRTIDLDTVFETPGTHTFWVVLSFHDMNYDGSDFDVEYLFIGTEAAKPDEEEEDPDKETGGQTDPEDDAEITLTDGATNVKVTGNLDADTVLNVTEITAGTDYDFVAGYMKSVSPKWEAYDVQLTLYGFPVSLTEDIVYSFPIPSTIGAEDAVIYYLADDGTLTLIDSFTEDGLLNVTTKLMGIFMIAEKSGSSTDIPATGDPIAVWPLVAVIISAGCMALLIRGRRKVS